MSGITLKEIFMKGLIYYFHSATEPSRWLALLIKAGSNLQQG